MSWFDTLLGAFGMMAEPQPQSEQVREALPSAYDPDANLSASQGGSAYYRRLSGPNPKRDLEPMTADRARDIANSLYLTNPLAKRGVEINRDWVMGEGMSIIVEPDQGDIARRDRQPIQEANDISRRAKKRQDERQEIVDRFWSDPANNLDMRLFDYVLGLGLFGEFLFSVATNPRNGATKLGIVDVGRIKAVITDPLNCGRPLAVELYPPSPGSPAPRLKHINVCEDLADSRYGRSVGALTDKAGNVVETYRAGDKTLTYAGSCILWSINKAPTAERGTSDLMTVIDFVDAIDQMHFSEIDRSQLIKAFTWDVTLTSAGPTEIDAWMKAHSDSPKPGSVRVHNDKEVWAAVQPVLNAWDYQSAIEVLINHICAGLGIPKGWVNGVQDVNKAQASEMAEPTMKRFEARQKFVIEKLEELCSFALDQAELAGRISSRRTKAGVLPEAWPIKVVAPEIRTKDLAATTKALSDAANALHMLVADLVIPIEAAQEASAQLLNELGVDADLETWREQIAEHKAETEAKAAADLAQQTDAQIAVKTAPVPPTPVRRTG